MMLRSLTLSLLAAAVGVTGLVATKPAVAAGEQFIPMLVYRTGPYAPSGIPAPTPPAVSRRRMGFATTIR